MPLLKISKLYKRFKLEDKESVEVLHDINITFPDTGLVGILGKSGCGKSTLLNLISILDKPTSGDIFIHNKSTKKWNRKRVERYRRREIGIVFQGYNLLDDHDVIYNIALPLLIDGYSYKVAKKKALNLLDSIGFSKELYHQKVNRLSGGEKQRVAILRGLITSPKIILCDEPTGALDSENSLLIMKLLKEISKDVLVIVVSHNRELLVSMSSYLIEMKEGRILSQKNIETSLVVAKEKQEERRIQKTGWAEKIAVANFKRRIGRNIISLVSLSICLLATTLVVGFIQNIDQRIEQECYKHLDIGVSTISKETSSKLEDTVITLVRSSRPSKEDINILKKEYNRYYYELNYDVLVPPFVSINLGENKCEEFTYSPVYSFTDKSIDKNLLLKGRFPNEDSLLEVVINKKAYEEMKSFTNEPINQWIDLSYRYETNYYTYDEDNMVINDVFTYEKRAKIVGVVDELNFLAVSTIYYPFTALDNYLSSYLLNNYSKYMGYSYSWKEKIQDEINTSKLTSYSYKMFLKNHLDYPYISQDKERIKDNYVITNNSLVIQGALMDLISASCIGVEIFLIIAIVGTILIVGLISFSSYSEDKKRSAILTCLGADLFQVIDIYIYENIMIITLSLIMAFLLLFPVKIIANSLLFNFVGITDIITLPNSILPNIALPYSYYLFIIIASILIVTLSTFLPIVFSKRISVIEELREE